MDVTDGTAMCEHWDAFLSSCNRVVDDVQMVITPGLGWLFVSFFILTQ